MRWMLKSVALLMLFATPALAADSTKVYNSGLLVLVFVGICALLVLAQVLPALKSLFGLSKEAKQANELHLSEAQLKKH